MPQGEQIPAEIQRIVVRLSRILTNEQIAMCIGSSERSIRRILHHFRLHGTIKAAEALQEEHKSSRHLRDIDVEVYTLPLQFFFISLRVFLVFTGRSQATTRLIPRRIEGNAGDDMWY